MMTIFDYIKRFSIQSPNNTALMDAVFSITYGELSQIIKKGKKYYLERGLKPDMCVCLQMENSVEWVIAFLCTLSVGCWVIPIPPETDEKSLQDIVKLTGAEDIITHCSLSDIIKRDLEPSDFDMPSGNGTGIFHLSSGSTGIPKICRRSLDNLTSEGISYRNTFQINQRDRILSLPPVYHSYCMGAGCMASLVSGASLYLPRKFVYRNAFRVIYEKDITMMLLVPIMARSLANMYLPEQIKPNSLRVVLVGAGIITQDINRKFADKFRINLSSNYGSTETGGVISRLTPEPIDSIGIPMDGVEIKVKNERLENCAFNHEGELWVRCSGMFSGYLNAEVKMDEDGFYPTGDIVVQDHKGYIFIKGRKKNIINIGGKKVNPYKVEMVLSQCAAVIECVVVPYKKVNGEEGVRAILVGDGLNERDLRNYCKPLLNQYEIPSVFEFWKSLPRNELGKIKRDLLTKKVD